SPGDAVRVWKDAESFAPCTVHHNGRVHAIAISPDGTKVATGADDHIVRVWSFVGGRLSPLGTLPPERSAIFAMSFSPSGNLLGVSTYQHSFVTLWDIAANRCRVVLPHPGAVHTVAFSANGRLALTAGYDGGTRLWDTVTGAPAVQTLDKGQMVL